MTVQTAKLPDETHEQLSSAGAFLRRALRFWRTALSMFVLGGVACTVFLVVRRPTYRSETVILYSDGPRPGDDAERPDTARSVTFRLKEILMSRASLDGVVREFDLYPDIQKTRGQVDAVEELRKHIEFRAPGGDTFSLAFTGASPSAAQAVTARLAEVVVGQDSDLRKKQATLVCDFLETQKRATEDGLRDAELALASFMAAHPRFALDATPLATGAAIRASIGDQAPLRRHRSARGRTRDRSSFAPRLPAGGLGGPEFARRRGSERGAGRSRGGSAGESRARSRASQSRRPRQPIHARLSGRTRGASGGGSRDDPAPGRDRRSRSSRKARRGSRCSAGIFSARRARAGGRAGCSDRSLSRRNGRGRPRPVGRPGAPEHDVVALETEWVKLTRGATEARQHQDQVEAALFKAKSAVDSENRNYGVHVTMIDPAFLPQSAVPPGRTMIVALFAGGALSLAIAAALLKALLSDRVYEERDIGQLAPVLALVPRRAHVSSR